VILLGLPAGEELDVGRGHDPRRLHLRLEIVVREERAQGVERFSLVVDDRDRRIVERTVRGLTHDPVRGLEAGGFVVAPELAVGP